jgi:activating signal cointegrator 1
MKCLSLTQPWASLVVLGAKHLETRSWQTAHRGPLAIHASRAFPPASRALVRTAPFRAILAAAGIHDWRELPTGLVIGTVEIVSCTRVEELIDVSPREHDFGDYRPGRWAWALARPQRLAVPFAWRGNLGLFDVPEDMLQVNESYSEPRTQRAQRAE